MSWLLAGMFATVAPIATYLQMVPAEGKAAWAKLVMFLVLGIPLLLYLAEYDESYSSSVIGRFGLTFFTFAAVVGVFE
jgi:hypothetical protein